MTRLEGPAFHWFALGVAPAKLPSIPGGELRAAGPLLLSSDLPIAIGRDGALYYARLHGRLQMMRGDSVFATLPASARWVNGLTVTPDGSLYYTEDAAVRKIDRRGVVSTIVENVAVPNCEPIPGTEYPPYLRGLAVAPDGTVYVAAAGCGALLKITRGRIEPLLRMRTPWSPTAVAVANGEIYVLEYLHTMGDDRRQWIPRVRKLIRDGKQVMLTR
ncbi:MAG TPA: hypothetical protein VKB93_17250 [Thermoanaerobaculia bacterium]|nr:hypothetical protein [Thermoanaerobaculia bacterium]